MSIGSKTGIRTYMSHVKLENVGVDFVMFGSKRNLRLSFIDGITGGRILPEKLKGKTVVIKALEGISLELSSGDRLGLLGHNGAGKSTLLRVLGGIYTPTAGKISINGKITPLLNQSPGMEPDDTGYDNILTVGMLLGMSLDKIKAKAPEIIAFSDLGDYIHLPVRTYSSGMLARLSFSIATSLDPGILLLDEGIGTADAKFADKASRRVKELLSNTDILVFASHNDTQIAEWCNKAALMHHGRMVDMGDVAEITKHYHSLLQSQS